MLSRTGTDTYIRAGTTLRLSRLKKRWQRWRGMTHALGFGSGMAAISTVILANIKAGDRIVATPEIYGGTFELLNNVLPDLNISTVFVNCREDAALLTEIEKGCSLLYLETPTNPLLRVVDVDPLAQAAHEIGAVVILDSTFASPVNQHPVDLGVDIAIHSGTKYLGGHHDITAGFVCCNRPHFEKIWNYRKIMGGVMDPMTAFLTLRGLKTLELRITKLIQSSPDCANQTTFPSIQPTGGRTNRPLPPPTAKCYRFPWSTPLRHLVPLYQSRKKHHKCLPGWFFFHDPERSGAKGLSI